MQPIFGLFHKRIKGDDALLELAKKQFAKTGLAPEYYGESPGEIEFLLNFIPWPESPAIVHLPRDIDLMSGEGYNRLISLAEEFKGRTYGFVLHDQKALRDESKSFEQAVRDLDAILNTIPDAPFIFIEYALMLPFDDFYDFFERITDLKKTGICLDIGHLGIRQVGEEFDRLHPGIDIFSFKNREKIPAQTITNIYRAVENVLPRVNEEIQRFCGLGLPIHFHLHDAHPLWDESPFGVSDHLSFFQEIFVRNEENELKKMPLMYGPEGLKLIIDTVRRSISLERVSFTLEIHPTEGKEPLNGFEDLFAHWRDKTNAEKMNFWVTTLQKNQQFLIEILKAGK